MVGRETGYCLGDSHVVQESTGQSSGERFRIPLLNSWQAMFCSGLIK